MAVFAIAVVPVGRLDAAEIEAAATRAAKPLREPLELRGALSVPQASEDAARGQHRAAMLLDLLSGEVLKLRPGRLVGGADAAAKPPPRPSGFVFVTDVDLFTARTDAVFAAMNVQKGCAVVSLRRLREAFYHRPADPIRQRSRLVKEVLRMAGRLRGASECPDPQCALSPSRSIPHVDAKGEKYCRACEQRLFEGRIRI